MLRAYTGAENAWTLVRELVWESVRVKSFPECPSRFDANFVCPSEDALRNFVSNTNRKFDLLYEVEFVDPSAPTFTADLALIDYDSEFGMPEGYQYYDAQATRYWKAADAIARPEVVTMSPIRITRFVSR